MKIAILTQPLGHNYGGIMQAWALQQVLKRMGHEPVTIDRQPDARGLAYRSARTVYRALRSAVGKSKGPVFPERVIPIVTKHTRDFIRTNLTMSPMIDSTEKLHTHFIDEGYEAVIVGSDQTWRPAYSPNLYNFFLDFLADQRLKRLAYASSFGVDQWEFTPEQTKKCAALVRIFDYVSVRESSGVRLCANHLGVAAESVLDPTLLLTAEDYRALINEPGSQKKSSTGLYTYLLDETSAKTALVKEVSAQIGLPIFNNQAEASLTDWNKGSIDRYIMPPITDWLSGFDRADFVITDSFHGTVFSIIFGKPFLAISNPSRGATRFNSLLSQLGLDDRLVHDPKNLPKHLLTKAPLSSALRTLSNSRHTSLSALAMHL